MISNRAVLTGYVLALTAGLSYGASMVITRWAVSNLAPPLAGVTISFIFGTLALWGLGVRRMRLRVREMNRKGLVYLLVSGLTAAVGVVTLYLALARAPTVAVAPLVSTSPLTTLLCVRLFLHQSERITVPVLAGALLIVLGGVLVSLG